MTKLDTNTMLSRHLEEMQGFTQKGSIPFLLAQAKKNVLFGHLVQVDSLGRHITFHSQLPKEKGSGKSSANIKKEQTKGCPGQAKYGSYLSDGKAGIQVSF